MLLKSPTKRLASDARKAGSVRAAVRLVPCVIVGIWVASQAGFAPPLTAAPADTFEDMARLGERIFRDTAHGPAAAFIGNDLACGNCHLDGGRATNSAPLGPAYVLYPQYRAKNRAVMTFAQRLSDCFRFSMNGKAPPLGDPVLVALETYAFSLAKGLPTGVAAPGSGFPRLAKPATAPDYGRGAAVFAARCASCHGTDGAGQKARDRVVVPPLWGERSFNWGAGMAEIDKATGFIKANMPLGQGGTLTDQEAWDVATFVDSHPRPQDPRFTGSVDETRAAFHETPMSMYGRTVEGAVLGAP